MDIIMKKVYIKPEIETVEVAVTHIIAASDPYDIWKDDEAGEEEFEEDNRSKEHFGNFSVWEE